MIKLVPLMPEFPHAEFIFSIRIKNGYYITKTGYSSFWYSGVYLIVGIVYLSEQLQRINPNRKSSQGKKYWKTLNIILHFQQSSGTYPGLF